MSAGITLSEFLLWERASRDTIHIKKAYVDMAGDLVTGAVLSEIVYWHLPAANGNTKLRVKHDGKFWIACRRDEWHDRTRISAKQADRALSILEERGLIEKKRYKFDGEVTVHIRLIESVFLAEWDKAVRVENGILPLGEIEFDETVKPDSTKGQNPITVFTTDPTTNNMLPNGKPRVTQSDQSDVAGVDVSGASAAKRLPRKAKPAKAPAATGERPRNALYDAVLAAWEIEGGRNARWCKWLSGESELDGLRFEQPVTADEVRAFKTWWRNRTPNPTINFVASAALVYRDMKAFRADAANAGDNTQRLGTQITQHAEETQAALERERAAHAEKLRLKREETARRLAEQNNNTGGNYD